MKKERKALVRSHFKIMNTQNYTSGIVQKQCSQIRARLFSKSSLARLQEFWHSSICLYEIKKKNLSKATCPTGNFTCPGPWGTGKRRARTNMSDNFVRQLKTVKHLRNFYMKFKNFWRLWFLPDIRHISGILQKRCNSIVEALDLHLNLEYQ